MIKTIVVKMIVKKIEMIVMYDEKNEKITRLQSNSISTLSIEKKTKKTKKTSNKRVMFQMWIQKSLNQKMQKEIKKLENLIVFIQVRKLKNDSFIDIDCTSDFISEKFDCFIESLKFAKIIRRRFHRIQIKIVKVFVQRKFVIIFFINIDVIVEKKHNMKILLNNENQINFISRCLMQRLKFSSKQFKSIRVKIVNENILRTYEMHFLNLKIKNQFNIVRYFIEFFLKIDLSNEQFILNFFFFTIINFNVDYEIRKFK